MKCSKCGKSLEVKEEKEMVYQVRAGHLEEVVDTFTETSEDEFVVDEDIGYYRSECLAKGV